jgi:hypothetical protein
LLSGINVKPSAQKEGRKILVDQPASLLKIKFILRKKYYFWRLCQIFVLLPYCGSLMHVLIGKILTPVQKCEIVQL